MKDALILFTRVPIPGQTKTRLMPFLTGEECARLHACFVKDIYEKAKLSGYVVFYRCISRIFQATTHNLLDCTVMNIYTWSKFHEVLRFFC